MGISSGLGRDALLPGLVLVASKTFTTTSSAQQIDGCFSSQYDNYRIVVSGVGSTTGNDWLRMRLVDGTSPISTGIYYISYFYFPTGSATPVAGFAGTQTSINFSTIGDTAFMGTMDISNPQAEAKTMGVSQFFGSASNDWLHGSTSFAVLNTTQYEGLYLYPGSGTWSGTIRVYGYRN